MSQMLRATYSCLVVFKEKPSLYASYIRAPIDGEVLKKITSILEILPVKDGESVLVLLWVPKEIGDACVLTTATHMPFRLFGINKELQKYYLACLDHKLYVYRDAKEEAAFGLAGKAYLRCTPQQTQNVHEYPEDQRPPCEDAIFTKNWGSFAVPVIDTNKRVGVLEFVMDTPRGYSNDILVVQRLLQDAGLQTSIQIDRTNRTYLHPKKMIRKSKSFDKTRYCRLVPLFGLSSARAAKILKVKPGTFTNLCRRVGIPEWPCIRNRITRASSIPEIKINQTMAEFRSLITPNADSKHISDIEVPEWPLEPIMTSDFDAWLSELPGLDVMADPFDTGYLDSFYDEEMINIDHLNADVNSIRDKGFPESSLEQTITIHADALFPKRFGPGFMSDLGEMEHHHDNYAPSMEYLAR
ncbi:putative transcription factor Nin-like family [Helianthus annuus]|nr:putative transcription factor Nin-like family [Helianthus annuus]